MGSDVMSRLTPLSFPSPEIPMDPKLKEALIAWADLKEQHRHEFVEYGAVSPRVQFSLNKATDNLLQLIDAVVRPC